MKPLDRTDSTDIAQICRNSDGRFDDLWTGQMVEPEHRVSGLGEIATAVRWTVAIMGALAAVSVAVLVLGG